MKNTRSMIRSYSELSQLKTFVERLEYLCLYGTVTEETFGSLRYLNQKFYTSDEWKNFRRDMIVRDLGCDLGVDGFAIHRGLILHHLNPLTPEEVINMSPALLDPENVICTTAATHKVIHYGSPNDITTEPIIRSPRDTCMW